MMMVRGRASTFVRHFSSTVSKKDDYSIASAFSNLKKQHDKLQSQQQQQKKSSVGQMFVNDFAVQTTYDPFDFSVAKTRYNKKINHLNKERLMKKSSFNADEVNPSDFYCMPHLLTKYMNTSGQIQHHTVTGLVPKKQKAMTKAIKRSRAFGFMSSVAKDVSTFTKRGPTL
ncbi:DEKNAAC100078 [Brettanomyces naardenensis]|uniref:Small ribosomal subunit protein bS18m n=1 Tax=Brettanomyces naardenensis TaxID=13370 RepID=A0A448YES0_BRENA|nr:DEKNAAC100078 [Brettanomyces naardenensis]